MDRSAERGRELLQNGNLIRKSGEEGYEVMVTTDQNMLHQQNLTGSSLGIVVLMPTAWPRVRHRTKEIRDTFEDVRPGLVLEVPT